MELGFEVALWIDLPQWLAQVPDCGYCHWQWLFHWCSISLTLVWY